MSKFDLKDLALQLSGAGDLQLEISPMMALCTVSLIQAALRHPRFTKDCPLSIRGRELIEILQEPLLKINPEFEQMIEEGWNPDLDMTEAEFQEYLNTGEAPKGCTYLDLSFSRKIDLVMNVNMMYQLFALLDRTIENFEPVFQELASQVKEKCLALSPEEVEAAIVCLENPDQGESQPEVVNSLN